MNEVAVRRIHRQDSSISRIIVSSILLEFDCVVPYPDPSLELA